MSEKPPVCPDCNVEGEKTLCYTMAEVSVEASNVHWTGEYYCPKCKKLLGT